MEVTRFLDWVTAECSAKPDTFTIEELPLKGRALVATASETCEISIARGIVITPSSARRIPEVQAAITALSAFGIVSRPLQIVLQLAFELGAGAASRSAPYIAVLPNPVHTLLHSPSLDGEVLDALLLGTPLHTYVADARSSLRAKLSWVASAVGQRSWCTEAHLLLAHGWFSSRALVIPSVAEEEEEGSAGIGIKGTGGVPAMVPLIDLANHKPGSLARFEGLPLALSGSKGKGKDQQQSMDTDSHSAMFDGLHMWDSLYKSGTAAEASELDAPQAKRARLAESDAAPTRSRARTLTLHLDSALARLPAAERAGREICIDYGRKSSEELLLYYGFALSAPNPADTLSVVLEGEGRPIARDSEGETTAALHLSLAPYAPRGSDMRNDDSGKRPRYVLNRFEPTDELRAAFEARALSSSAKCSGSRGGESSGNSSNSSSADSYKAWMREQMQRLKAHLLQYTAGTTPEAAASATGGGRGSGGEGGGGSGSRSGSGTASGSAPPAATATPHADHPLYGPSCFYRQSLASICDAQIAMLDEEDAADDPISRYLAR
jgi:hypothetical protein